VQSPDEMKTAVLAEILQLSPEQLWVEGAPVLERWIGQRPPNTYLVLRAWKLARTMGLPIPEWVLRAIDAIADRANPLVLGDTQPSRGQELAAVGFRPSRGGRSAWRDFKKLKERRRLAVEILLPRSETDHRPNTRAAIARKHKVARDRVDRAIKFFNIKKSTSPL